MSKVEIAKFVKKEGDWSHVTEYDRGDFTKDEMMLNKGSINLTAKNVHDKGIYKIFKFDTYKYYYRFYYYYHRQIKTYYNI